MRKLPSIDIKVETNFEPTTEPIVSTEQAETPLSPKISPTPHPQPSSSNHFANNKKSLQPIKNSYVCTICGTGYNSSQLQKYLHHTKYFHNEEEKVIDINSKVVSTNKTFIRDNKIFICDLHRITIKSNRSENKILLFLIRAENNEKVLTPIFILKDVDMFHLLKEITLKDNRFDFQSEHKFRIPFWIYKALKIHIYELYKVFMKDYSLDFKVIYEEVKENLSKVKEELIFIKEQIAHSDPHHDQKVIIYRNVLKYSERRKRK